VRAFSEKKGSSWGKKRREKGTACGRARKISAKKKRGIHGQRTGRETEAALRTSGAAVQSAEELWGTRGRKGKITKLVHTGGAKSKTKARKRWLESGRHAKKGGE